LSSTLYTSVNFTRDIPIIRTSIYEYDIAKANISVLLNRGRISLATYKYLYGLDNMARKVIIGKMERENPDLTKEKQLGITQAKQYLFEANGIEDHEVISIKNDAVFVTRELEHTEYNHAKFTLRNTFELFMRALKLEFYYHDDFLTDNNILVIKGVNDEKLALHEDYLMEFFRQLLARYLRWSTPTSAITLLRDFYESYTARELDIGFYRDLKTGSFIINTESMIYNYDLLIPDPSMIDLININDNTAILRSIARNLYAVYFRR